MHLPDRVALAASLIPNGPTPPTSKTHPEAGDPDYPIVPGEEDLIGFITTGNFNLGEGRGTGIGCIALAKVQNPAGKSVVKDGFCIIREAGLGTGRIAKWELI
jgi:ribonuclease P/MRP protein subunit POP1